MALLLQLTQKLAHGFQAFYARYPLKKARKDAEKAWTQVKPTPETEEAIHAALDWQIPYWQSMEWYTPPYPASYLRGERWTDEQPKTTINRATAKVVPLMAQQQMDAASRIKSLIAAGVPPDDAKQTVYREMGWVKE